jgi:hypothetical protein
VLHEEVGSQSEVEVCVLQQLLLLGWGPATRRVWAGTGAPGHPPRSGVDYCRQREVEVEVGVDVQRSEEDWPRLGGCLDKEARSKASRRKAAQGGAKGQGSRLVRNRCNDNDSNSKAGTGSPVKPNSGAICNPANAPPHIRTHGPTRSKLRTRTRSRLRPPV